MIIPRKKSVLTVPSLMLIATSCEKFAAKVSTMIVDEYQSSIVLL